MKTLALVIGNNDYLGDSKLDNAVNDSQAIAETFERLNYDVISKTNCKSSDYGEALTEFEKRVVNYDALIFYFAGHGFQFGGENYLASIECPIENPNKHICERTCIRLTEITDIIRESNTKVNIIIIDACRRSFERGVSNSFTQINAPEGTIIAFSTSPGEGAKDAGMEGHSLYTGALLKYLGRELMSVEELFKKVRKTVYNLSNGSQTSWEHTSLVGDFFFNTGQMVHSVSIPYDEIVVKDRMFLSKGTAIDNIITDLASTNWNAQNPAMDRFNALNPTQINKDEQFIIGRNILQSAGYAHNSTNFMDNLGTNLFKYNNNGENHLLNGMLFEIYFDNNGDFRRGNFKNYYSDKVLELRHLPQFKKSFEFIANALSPFNNELFYIPSNVDSVIDIDILASVKKVNGTSGNEVEYQIIESIICQNKDITKPISSITQIGTNSEYLKKVLSEYLVAPIELLNLNENIEIEKLAFRKDLE